MTLEEKPLTAHDIRNAVKKLKENSDAQKEDEQKRSLKDFSKLTDFYKKIEECTDFEEKFGMLYMVNGLAQGKFLIVPPQLYEKGRKELKEKWCLPDEILDNIYKSNNL